LPALVRRVARIAYPGRAPIVPADGKTPAGRERAGPRQVAADHAVIGDTELEHALGRRRRLARDEIDGASDRTGSEDRGGAAAHSSRALNRAVDAHELVGVVERQLEDGIQRKAVYHQADITVSAILDDAASEHVAVRRTRRGFHPEPWYGSDQVGRAVR